MPLYKVSVILYVPLPRVSHIITSDIQFPLMSNMKCYVDNQIENSLAFVDKNINSAEANWGTRTHMSWGEVEIL